MLLLFALQTLLVMRLKICLSLPAVLNSLLQTVDSSRILSYAKMCVFGKGCNLSPLGYTYPVPHGTPFPLGTEPFSERPCKAP